uniref:Uncharacterized protein n=1 Tax=Scleropages formosus TaxID=113540 RepID=A0A8C9RCJ6_SCLFO
MAYIARVLGVSLNYTSATEKPIRAEKMRIYLFYVKIFEKSVSPVPLLGNEITGLDWSVAALRATLTLPTCFLPVFAACRGAVTRGIVSRASSLLTRMRVGGLSLSLQAGSHPWTGSGPVDRSPVQVHPGLLCRTHDDDEPDRRQRKKRPAFTFCLTSHCPNEANGGRLCSHDDPPCHLPPIHRPVCRRDAAAT